jgi:DNA-binding HxlR family transcriptional regulator
MGPYKRKKTSMQKAHRCKKQDQGALVSEPSEHLFSHAERALQLLCGKWTLSIIAELMNGPIRVGELRRRLGRVSKKILFERLDKLEQSGLVIRTDRSDKNLKRVEYELQGESADAVVSFLRSLNRSSQEHLTSSAHTSSTTTRKG